MRIIQLNVTILNHEKKKLNKFTSIFMPKFFLVNVYFLFFDLSIGETLKVSQFSRISSMSTSVFFYVLIFPTGNIVNIQVYLCLYDSELTVCQIFFSTNSHFLNPSRLPALFRMLCGTVFSIELYYVGEHPEWFKASRVFFNVTKICYIDKPTTVLCFSNIQFAEQKAYQNSVEECIANLESNFHVHTEESKGELYFAYTSGK